jgi:hypothetical protein
MGKLVNFKKRSMYRSRKSTIFHKFSYCPKNFEIAGVEPSGIQNIEIRKRSITKISVMKLASLKTIHMLLVYP